MELKRLAYDRVSRALDATQLAAPARVSDHPAMLPRLALSLALTGLCTCAPARPERPSVVLVLVDQLRHDAAERWLSATRALAEQGVCFEEMRSVAPWTYPSVISLFSGLYPQQHGANADQAGKRLTTIDERVPLLPRTLRASGYHTAAFITNPFLHEWNHPVRDSFVHFDASFIHDQGPTRGHGELVWTKEMYADTVNPRVRTYFDARPLREPEFTYVHYIDVHGRKEGPERYVGAPFEASYEAAVRFIDGKVRELYEYFSARYGGNVLFLVTSDHGQDLGDELELGAETQCRARKASLHDFNLRIPLYILPSALVPRGRVVREPCANIDIAPTLYDWLGLASPLAVPGRSLLGAIRGAEGANSLPPLYARNETGGRIDEGLVTAEQKFLRTLHVQSGTIARNLFDLRADPRELVALPQDTVALENALDAAAAIEPVFPAHFEEPDEATREKLDALGYGGQAEERR